MSTDTLSRVVALVHDVYGTAQPIAADTALDALDGDSLGRVLLAIEVEKAFGVVVPRLAEEQWRTVADIVAAVEKPRIAGPWITDDAGSTGHYREDMDDPTRDSLALFAWVDGFDAHRWIVWTTGDASHVVAQGDGCATMQEAHDAADAAARENGWTLQEEGAPS